MDSPVAGVRLVRGTAVRASGYGAGLGLALLATPFLTRHLGVDDFGRWAVVGSLVAVTTIVADAGLATVGIRDYAVRAPHGRQRLMATLLTARIMSATVAAMGAVAFTVVAGYDQVIVVGTVLGALALVFTVVQQTYLIPPAAELRLEFITFMEVMRQILNVAGILLFVVFGSELLGFYVLPIPVAILVLVLTLRLIGSGNRTRPNFDTRELRYLFAETIPAGSASVLSSLFYRIALVVMALVASDQQTGYFGISFRVSEIFVAVPPLIVASALPLLARIAEADHQRLRGAFQRLFDVSVILGGLTMFCLVVGAKPVIGFLGGSEFAPAVPVLRIQGAAIGATFLVTLFSGMLWVVRAKRQLVIGNAFGLVAAGTLTLVFVPLGEAKGAAFAMVCAESLLLLWLGVALLGRRPELRPSLRTASKVLVALSLAFAFVLLPVPDLVALILGSVAYIALLAALRALPSNIWREALLGTRQQTSPPQPRR